MAGMMWITIIDYQLGTSEQQLKQAWDNYSVNDFMFAFSRFEQHLLAQVCSPIASSPASNSALIRPRGVRKVRDPNSNLHNSRKA